jgi:hypothetical protein
VSDPGSRTADPGIEEMLFDIVPPRERLFRLHEVLHLALPWAAADGPSLEAPDSLKSAKPLRASLSASRERPARCSLIERPYSRDALNATPTVLIKGRSSAGRHICPEFAVKGAFLMLRNANQSGRCS